MIRLLLLLCSLAWPVTRTHQELIDLAGRKGDITHLYDLYSRTPCAALSEYASFAAALTAAPPCLAIGDTVTLAANATVPAGTALQVLPGGYFTGAFTLTVNGAFIAGRYKVFDASLTAALDNGSCEAAAVEWWGAVGDNSTNSTTAIQRALNATRASAMELSFAAGTYRIHSSLTITGDGNAVRLTGKGKAFTWIRAAASMGAVLAFPNGAVSVTNYTTGSYIDGVSFDGNSLADYGILAVTNHGTFKNFRVTGTLVAALDISHWNNTFTDLRLDANADGLRLDTRGASNGVTVTGCKIFNNSGYGITAASSYGLGIFNLTIELNAKAGIFFRTAVQGFSIVGSTYGEGNGATGHVFRSPALDTVRADILINGSSADTTVANASTCTGVITGSTVNAGSARYHVFAPGQAGLVVEGCRRSSADSIVLVGTYGNPSTTSPEFSYSSVNNIRIGINVGWESASSPLFQIRPLGYDILKATPTNAFISSASNRNLAVTDFSAWSVITAASGGTFTSSAEVFPYDGQASVYALTLGTTSASDAYGFSLNAANYTPYHGKYFLFGIYMKHTEVANISGSIRLNPQGTIRVSEMDYRTGSDVGWQLNSVIFKFPTSGTVSFAVQKVVQGGGAAGSVYVANPVLCEYGSNFQTLQGIR